MAFLKIEKTGLKPFVTNPKLPFDRYRSSRTAQSATSSVLPGFVNFDGNAVVHYHESTWMGYCCPNQSFETIGILHPPTNTYFIIVGFIVSECWKIVGVYCIAAPCIQPISSCCCCAELRAEAVDTYLLQTASKL